MAPPGTGENAGAPTRRSGPKVDRPNTSRRNQADGLCELIDGSADPAPGRGDQFLISPIAASLQDCKSVPAVSAFPDSAVGSALHSIVYMNRPGQDPRVSRCAVGRGGSIVDHRSGTTGRLKCYLGHSRATFEALIGHPLLSYRAFAEGGSRELVSGTGLTPSRASLTDKLGDCCFVKFRL